MWLERARAKGAEGRPEREPKSNKKTNLLKQSDGEGGGAPQELSGGGGAEDTPADHRHIHSGHGGNAVGVG